MWTFLNDNWHTWVYGFNILQCFTTVILFLFLLSAILFSYLSLGMVFLY